MDSNLNLDTAIHDHTVQTLCLTLVTFILRLIEWCVELDAILTFVMHIVILISSIFAIVTGFFALRDRYRNRKSL